MAIAISLQYKNHLYYTTINSNTQVSFGSGKKDTVKVDSMTEGQYVFSAKGAVISLKQNDRLQTMRDDLPLERHVVLDNGETVLFMSYHTGESEYVLKLPFDGDLTVGRNSGNDIVIGLPFVSGRHFVVRVRHGEVWLEDLNSTNGLFLNGRRVRQTPMRFGDVLQILTVQIRLVNGSLYFMNVGNALRINWKEADNAPQGRKNSRDKYLNYRRSPRIRERMPSEPIIISNPPAAAQIFDTNNNVANIINYGAMMATTLAYGMANPMLLALRTATSASNMFFSGKRNKEMKEKLETYERDRREKYTAYMADQLAKITKVAEVQKRILTNENPDPKGCYDSVMKLKRNIWERTPGDDDFLRLRLGMGPNNLCVDLKCQNPNTGFVMQTDAMEELQTHTVEENIVVNSPVNLSLMEYNSIGIIGDRVRAIHLVRNMILSLATLHMYKDVRIVGIFDEEERGSWAALRWLPHIWDDNKQFRFLSFDAKRAHMVCEVIHDIAKKRMFGDGDSHREQGVELPYYICIFGSRTKTEYEPLIQTLSNNDEPLGITALYLYDDVYFLPRNCEYILDLTDEPTGYERYSRNMQTCFVMDQSIDRRRFDEFARWMAAIKLVDVHSQNTLPNTITFLEGYGVKRAEDLNVFERWTKNAGYRSLAAPLGVTAAGKVFSLDIHSDADGAHGLIAGTTGSGKSELIQSLILSMAVNYHPHEVNFVIIDYKGGSMANLLEGLPHVVGKMTNIDTNIQRILVSIEAEIQRREMQFKDSGVSSIGQYQRMYKRGQVSKPMPHLVLISDEFAELKREEPEFMSALTSFARVGRSLGIHVLLATQKPAGVVNDQIDANSRFRICMKVNDVSDSRELLKHPDAATITQAGRAYVRVGNDEIYELIQSFYSGAEYKADNRNKQEFTNKVSIVDVSGQRIGVLKFDKTNGFAEKTELDAVIEHLKAVAAANHIAKLPGLWLDELPTVLPFDSIKTEDMFDGAAWHPTNGHFAIPVGIFDCPRQQSQGIQYLDFGRFSHFVVFGGASSGKTSFLKTVILSAACVCSPKELNMYIMDFGGRSMSGFESLPQVGCAAMDYEEEKLEKLKQMLLHEIEVRKQFFEKKNISSFYNSHVGELPSVLLIVDNYLSASKQFPSLDEMFEKVCQEGSTYGIHMIFTANNQMGISHRVMNNIPSAIALRLNDRNEYSQIVGHLDGAELPNVPGRALIKGNPPIAFQTALWNTGGDMRELVDKMNRASLDSKAKAVAVTPEDVYVKDMAAAYIRADQIPIGIALKSADILYADLSEKYVLNICDESFSAAQEAEKTITSLLCKGTANRVYLLDGADGPLGEFRDGCAAYVSYEDGQELKNVLNEIIDILTERQTDGCDNSMPQICMVISDICHLLETVEEQVKNALTAIFRNGRGLGILVVVTSQVDEFLEYNVKEPLAMEVAASQKCIVLSGLPSKYSCYHSELSYDEKFTPIEKDVLYFDNGKVTAVRLAKRG